MTVERTMRVKVTLPVGVKVSTQCAPTRGSHGPLSKMMAAGGILGDMAHGFVTREVEVTGDAAITLIIDCPLDKRDEVATLLRTMGSSLNER